jgi:hypothetical protein
MQQSVAVEQAAPTSKHAQVSPFSFPEQQLEAPVS